MMARILAFSVWLSPLFNGYARVTRFSASRSGTSRADTPSQSPDVVTTPHPRVRTLHGRRAPGTFTGDGAPGNISACSVELALREMGTPSLLVALDYLDLLARTEAGTVPGCSGPLARPARTRNPDADTRRVTVRASGS